MSFLLEILPTDVLILITNIWLDDCIKDVCALDAAIVNKELRKRYVLASCLTIKKEGLMKQIRIRTEDTLIAISKWKEARGLDIKRIYFKQYNLPDYHLPNLGTLFPHLQEIELCACFIRLHHILFASLTDLRKLTLTCCRIVISKEILHNPLFTNIEELQILFNIGNMHYNVDGDIIPTNKQGEIYLWIAKCCPKVKVCSMNNCSVSCMTAIQMMQEWPLLKEWKLILACFDRFASNDYLNVLNPQVSIIKKANLESITLGGNYKSDEKYLLDILLTCCNVAELRSLVLFISDWPAEYSQRFMQSIRNMHNMKHLTLKGRNNSTFPAIVDAVLDHCHALETLHLVCLSDSAEGLTLFQVIATPNHFHLAHLTSLHLQWIKLTDESITILCNSVYAKQLTSLCLKGLRGVSFEAYQQVFTSFNQLQSFDFFFSYGFLQNEMLQKEYFKKLLSLLDALFDDNCAFGSTLQTLTVSAYCYDTSRWKDKQFMEEMLHDHLIPHWKFPFPNLQSCHVDLQIGDSPIAALIMKRLLVNCPALHTLDLKLMRHEHTIQLIQNQELIRRMREQYI